MILQRLQYALKTCLPQDTDHIDADLLAGTIDGFDENDVQVGTVSITGNQVTGLDGDDHISYQHCNYEATSVTMPADWNGVVTTGLGVSIPSLYHLILRVII